MDHQCGTITIRTISEGAAMMSTEHRLRKIEMKLKKMERQLTDMQVILKELIRLHEEIDLG